MKETNETKGRQPTEWEKIFANRMPNKKLISKTYDECIQLNIKKINDQISKQVEDLNRHFPKKDMQVATCMKNVERHSTPLIIREKQVKNHNVISPHNCQNGYHQKDNKEQVLVRCGGNGTLVYSWWKQIYAAPMENRMEVPQKMKNRTAL